MPNIRSAGAFSLSMAVSIELWIITTSLCNLLYLHKNLLSVLSSRLCNFKSVQPLKRNWQTLNYSFLVLTKLLKLSISSLYIISDAPKYDIIWTGNSVGIDSFISELLKYKSWILASWHKRSWTERFTLVKQQQVKEG